MTIQDLKYITPLDIQAAHLNVTSAEMYDEAKKFNMHMYDMQRKRRRFLRDMWGILILNVIMFALAIPTATSPFTSLVFKATGGSGPVLMATGGNLPLTYLPAAIYAVAFIYFILIKKLYNWKLILLLSLIAVPTHYAFIMLAIGNAVLVKKIYETDEEIKDEVGYPGFAELLLSFIRDEESLEEGGMDTYSDDEKSDDLESERKDNPFDKYRTRWSDGEGLLRDSDISDPTE
jgi:hypothetical protein